MCSSCSHLFLKAPQALFENWPKLPPLLCRKDQKQPGSRIQMSILSFASFLPTMWGKLKWVNRNSFTIIVFYIAVLWNELQKSLFIILIDFTRFNLKLTFTVLCFSKHCNWIDPAHTTTTFGINGNLQNSCRDIIVHSLDNFCLGLFIFCAWKLKKGFTKRLKHL